MTTQRAPVTGRVAAAQDPVARLIVDMPLPHLDHPFDYLVPESLAEDVVAGSRVRVRFAGRLVDAFVLERSAGSEHDGRLAFVERVVGEPVLTAETAALFRAVADRWAGSFVDVVRLGVPARHAATESSAPGWPAAQSGAQLRPPQSATGGPSPPVSPSPDQSPRAAGSPGFGRYRAGAAFLAAVADGRAARAVWSALPGECWPQLLAGVVQAALAAGRGAVVVVPDARDLARLDAALTEQLAARQPRQPVRRARTGRAVPALACGPARRRAGRSRDSGGRIRAGRRSRPARHLGRRRRPARRAARALPARARSARAALLAHRRCTAGGRVRADRRGATARRVRMGARDRGRPARQCALLRRASSPWATTSSKPATRPRPRPGCRAWPGAPRGTRSPPAVRCWSRCRAAVTSRRWPASATEPRRGARSAPARSPPRRPARSRRADGAGARRRGGGARPATAPGCARSWSAPGAPPRSWAARSPASRS